VVAMLVLLQADGVATVPLNVKVLVPRLAPKLLPLIVTGVPTFPELGARLSITGAEVTVNVMPLLATPPTVTTNGPVVAPSGTGTSISELFHV
jgi:hypothetical protein